MLDPVSITSILVAVAALGYLSTQFHSRCLHSSCCYGCCEIDEADTDISLIKEGDKCEKEHVKV